MIVDPAALVNHVLPYSELFGPNAVGTAELLRIALTTKLKAYTYVSTIGVGDQIQPGTFVEDADVREISATRKINDGYANGYGNSKWAGEVLLREATRPVRPAGRRVPLRHDPGRHHLRGPAEPAGHVHPDDAQPGRHRSPPGSFYELDADGNRQRAHYDGLPVEFIAEAVSELGAQVVDGSNVNVMNPYDDGIGLDEYVDWLTDAGYSIQRVGDYDAWLQRFETTLRGLPERQRQYSLLPLLHNYQQPQTPINGSMAPTDRFAQRCKKRKSVRTKTFRMSAAGDRQIHHRSAPARTAVSN